MHVPLQQPQQTRDSLTAADESPEHTRNRHTTSNKEDLREPCLRQQGCGRSVCRNPVRTEHQRLAGYAAACREPDSEGCFRDPRSGYDNRRADSIRRDFFLPFQPARTGRVHPVKKDPAYVGRAKEVQVAEKAIQEGNCPAEALPELKPVFAAIHTQYPDIDKTNVGVGSTIFAVKPGDGSAREQAASCQKVLGGWANIANEYATKRYRSNLINWGMLPFVVDADLAKDLRVGDYLVIPRIREAVEKAHPNILPAWCMKARRTASIKSGRTDRPDSQGTYGRRTPNHPGRLSDQLLQQQTAAIEQSNFLKLLCSGGCESGGSRLKPESTLRISILNVNPLQNTAAAIQNKRRADHIRAPFFINQAE